MDKLWRSDGSRRKAAGEFAKGLYKAAKEARENATKHAANVESSPPETVAAGSSAGSLHAGTNAIEEYQKMLNAFTQDGNNMMEQYYKVLNGSAQNGQTTTHPSTAIPSTPLPYGNFYSASTAFAVPDPNPSTPSNAQSGPAGQAFSTSSPSPHMNPPPAPPPSMTHVEPQKRASPSASYTPPTADKGMTRRRAFLCHEGTIKPGILSVLCRELERQGLREQVYYDMFFDRGGTRDETLEYQLTTALQNTDNLVVFFTPEFLQSKWPLWELKTFFSMMDADRTRSKRLIPVFYGISARQCKNISRGDFGSTPSIAHCTEEVRGLLGRAVQVIGIDAKRENNHMSDDQVVQEIMRNVFGNSFVAIENVDEASKLGARREQMQIAENLCRYAEVFQAGNAVAFVVDRMKVRQSIVDFLSAASHLGDKKAMVMLGNIYSQGQGGIARNDVKAMELYVEAFSNGYAEAGVYLGNAALLGEGLPEDAQRAAEYYQRSGERGCGNGKARYGLCLELGLGVAVNHTEATKHYKLSSDQGDSFGVCLYALCLRKGIGCEQNATGAERLLDRITVEIMLESADHLRRSRISPCKAAELYRCGAERGDNVAKCYLGMCYEEGIGVQMDRSRASRLYQEGGGMLALYQIAIQCKSKGDMQGSNFWQRRASGTFQYKTHGYSNAR